MLGSNEKIAKVKITGDASGLDKSTKQAEGSLKSFKVQALAVVSALAGLWVAINKGIKGYIDYDNEQKKITATLKATSSQAGITARDINKLTDELQSMTTRGGGELIELQTNLLKFGNIKKDIFEPTTRAIVDMATALGQDLKSASDLVGRALEDPIQGLTMLRRSGVSFTEAQQEQIKALVQSNQLYEAQQIVLGGLNSRFGGLATAMAQNTGVFEQTGEDLGDLWEQLGQAVFEVIQPVAIWFRDFVRQVRDSSIVLNISREVMQALSQTFRGFAVIGKAVVDIYIAIFTNMLKVSDFIYSAFIPNWKKINIEYNKNIGLLDNITIGLFALYDWFNSKGNIILSYWERLKASIYEVNSALSIFSDTQKATFDRMGREARDRAVGYEFQARSSGTAEELEQAILERNRMRDDDSSQDMLFGEETERQIVSGGAGASTGGAGGEVSTDLDDIATLLQKNPDALLTEEQKTAYLDFLAQQGEGEINLLEQQNERKLAIEEEFRSKMNSTVGGALTNLLATEKHSYKQREDTAKVFNDSLLNLAQSFGERGKNIAKGFNIAQAVMATYTGATEALKLGWPLGPIKAGVIMASGFANVRNIAGAREGTIVDGTDTGKDNRLMRVRSGEAIIPPQYVSGVMPKLAQLVKEEEKTGRITDSGQDVRVMIEFRGDAEEFIQATLLKGNTAGTI